MLALPFSSPSSSASSRPSLLPVGRGCAGACAAAVSAGGGAQWRPPPRDIINSWGPRKTTSPGRGGGSSSISSSSRRRTRDDQLGGSLAGPRPSSAHSVTAAAGAPLGAREGVGGGGGGGYGKSGVLEEEEEMAAPFPPELNPEFMPRHVAVIMDGNSRWARERGLPTSAGHEAGYRALREMVRLSGSWGVKVLTVFAFSSENWLRPKTEVDFLMRLFEGVIRDNLEDFKRQGIRLCIIGDSTKLPKSLQDLAKEAADVTKHNAVIELLVAVSYSGRSDIVQACQKIAQRVRDGLLEPGDITESVIEEELETNCTINSPYPDLLIRTSGELRLSNFLLWQSAYSELYFSNSLWPDFGEAEYIEALSSFQQRQRRFGKRI